MAWTSPRTWVSGEVPTATVFNTHVRDNLKAIGDPWTAYTPSLTGSGTTQGNASLTGAYVARGKTIDFWAMATLGSTSVIGSQVRLLLPFTAKATNQIGGLYGMFTNSGANFYLALPFLASTSTFGLAVIGTNGAAAATSATVPFTWSTNDIILASGTYEAA